MHQQEATAGARRQHDLAAWDRFRLGLLAACLLVLAATVGLGQRETPLADLRAAVTEGRVDRVVVLGEPVRAEQGYGTQVVQWQDGVVRRTTEAMVGAPPGADTADLLSLPEDLAALLTRIDPELEVRRSAPADTTWSGLLLGWQVPTWLALAALAVLLLQVGYLVSVPQTWRATRWAWFWVLSVPVVGSVLLLLLSGRTPGLPPPAGRRLTGGWAFLLACVAGTVLSDVVSSVGL